MANLYRPRAFAKLTSEPLNHIDRPVPPAGAAECDRKIAAVNDVEVPDPEVNKGFQLPGHLVNEIRSLKKLDNGLVEARQVPKLFFPIGVRQAAKVEDGVSIRRRSTLEAERLEQQCRARLQRALGKTADGHTQFKRCHDACIDCALRHISQRGQHLAFAQDPFTQRRVFVGQGMPSSRLAIPLQ